MFGPLPGSRRTVSEEAVSLPAGDPRVNFLESFYIYREKRYIPNMRTIREVLARVIDSTPFLEGALADGIVNLTALARKIRPEVEADLLRPVSIGSLVMALKRLIPSIEDVASSTAFQWNVADLTIRPHLSELTLQWSDTILARQQQLLEAVREGAERFVSFIHGVREVTVIMDADLEHLAHEIFNGERCLSRLSDLAAITLRHCSQSVSSTRVHYDTLKRLAMKTIDVVEVISTPTELTVVLDRSEVDRAFSILRTGGCPA